MPKKLYHVELTETEREQLATYIKHGTKPARAMNRARILLLADEHYRDEDMRDT